MSCSCCLLIGVWLTVSTWVERVCGAYPRSSSFCRALPNDKSCLYGAVGCLLLIMGSCCIEPGNEMPWTFHTIGATGFFLCQVISMCSITSNLSKAAREAEKLGQEAPSGVSPLGLKVKRGCVHAFVVLLCCEAALPLLGVPGWGGALLEWLLTATVMVWVVSLSYDFEQAKLYAAFVEPQQELPPSKA